MIGRRRALDAHIIEQLRATVADQQDTIDELTRTVAAWRLIARALVGRPVDIETR